MRLNERTDVLLGHVRNWVHTTPTPSEIAAARKEVAALRAEVGAFVAS